MQEKNKNFYGTLIMLSNHTPFSDIEHLPDPIAVDYKYEKENPETGEKETVSAPYMEGTKLGNYFKFVHFNFAVRSVKPNQQNLIFALGCYFRRIGNIIILLH